MGNMVAVAPALTEEGKALLIRAISGEKIVFTKFKIGNGEATEEGVEKLNDLVNPIVEFAINEFDNSQAGYVTVSGKFDSTNITTDFRWRELGVFCKVEDEDEVLFGYCNDADDAGILKANSTDRMIEQTVSFVIAIGDAQNVTAMLSESMVYVSKTEFEEHLDAENPHGVDAEKVGLGNVPNVSTNDQTPTYIVPNEAAELTSGEKLSIAFGKIAAAVKSMLSHIKATGNVHNLDLKSIGAAASEHEHSAADINSGILGLKRGGTGASNAKEALANLGGVAKSGDTIMTGNLQIRKDNANVTFGTDDENTAILVYTENGNADLINVKNAKPTTLSLSNENLHALSQLLRLWTSDGQFYNIYGEHNKPTAADVGALPKTGGKLSGGITLDKPDYSGEVSFDQTYNHRASISCFEDSIHKAYRSLFLNNKARGLDMSYALTLFDKIDENDTTGTTYRIYGEHNKPTADDVGALPLTGGTLSNNLHIKRDSGAITSLLQGSASEKLAYSDFHMTDKNGNFAKVRLQTIGIDGKEIDLDRVLLFLYKGKDASTHTSYRLYGEHNKPSGSYVGNNQERDIDIGGMGDVLLIMGEDDYTALITPYDNLYVNTKNVSSSVNSAVAATFSDGVLHITQTSLFNTSGITYRYYVL